MSGLVNPACQQRDPRLQARAVIYCFCATYRYSEKVFKGKQGKTTTVRSLQYFYHCLLEEEVMVVWSTRRTGPSASAGTASDTTQGELAKGSPHTERLGQTSARSPESETPPPAPSLGRASPAFCGGKKVSLGTG